MGNGIAGENKPKTGTLECGPLGLVLAVAKREINILTNFHRSNFSKAFSDPHTQSLTVAAFVCHPDMPFLVSPSSPCSHFAQPLIFMSRANYEKQRFLPSTLLLTQTKNFFFPFINISAWWFVRSQTANLHRAVRRTFGAAAPSSLISFLGLCKIHFQFN